MQVAPPRSLVQRREALERANEIRVFRAQIKQDLTRERAAELILEPPAQIFTMKVAELISACWATGPAKTQRMLTRANVSPSKNVAGLTQRQRESLVADCLRAPRSERERIERIARDFGPKFRVVA